MNAKRDFYFLVEDGGLDSKSTGSERITIFTY